MDIFGPLDDLSGSELLDTADALARLQRRSEVTLLRVAAQWAVVNNPDTLDPQVSKLPGRERAKRFGGHGTPMVREFAAAELAVRIGRSAYAARILIADSLDLQHRFPQHWARVEAGEVRASYARYVARRCRELPLDQALYVDGRVAESADGRISWSRFETLVEAAIKAADPEAAAAREEEARRRQFARATRSDEEGLRGFYVRAHVGVIARLDAMVQHVAEALAALGDQGSIDDRRVKAVLVLTDPAHALELLAAYRVWKDRPADPPMPPDPDTTTAPAAPDHPDHGPAGGDEPVLTEEETTGESAESRAARTGPAPEVDWRRLWPAVQLFVHLYGGTREGFPDATGVARVEGHAPVTEQWLRGTLGEQARFTVRPVLDIEGMAPVDAYEIPDRHRQAVRLMTPADVFPHSDATVNRPDGWPAMQVDHTEPWAPDGTGGQSGIGNYGPMTTGHHRVKTHGGWQVRQPFPGIYVWRAPDGSYVLVDHTGTRPLAA